MTKDESSKGKEALTTLDERMNRMMKTPKKKKT